MPNRLLTAFIATLVLTSALFAVGTPIPSAPTRWVTDEAGFMSPAAVADLDAKLKSFADSTGHQMIVYVGKTTGGVSIEEWAVKAFAAWKVGRKGINDGLALIIMAEDRKLRFEVGYGLEGQVPDLIAARIIKEVMVPRIRGKDQDGAVYAGMDAVAAVITGKGLSGQAYTAQHRQARPGQMSLGKLILFGILAALFLGFLATHPSAALFLLASMLSNGSNRGGGFGGGSGFGGGGGGFSGGGGMSGGGGASGSW